MAKAKSEEREYYRPGDDAKPMNEALRKKMFPNVPPPTLKQLKERKNNKKHER